MDKTESLSESLQRYKENAIIENELWSFVESLVSDLETCKTENAELRNQLNDLLKKDNSSSKLYLEVEEENSEIKNENRTLKFKLNAQKLQFKSEKFEIEGNCEMKIRKLEEELCKIKQKFNQKEAEFFEELQMAQATSAYEFEKIEKKLKWQLSEANKHLYESNLINSKLRSQLENMHNESIRAYKSDDISMSKKSGITTDISKIIDASNDPKPDTLKKTEEMSHNTPLRTYEPLQVECCSVLERNTEKQTPPLFKGKSHSSKKMNSYKSNPRNNADVPPLIPCSDAVIQKKRKLYDPDDLSYLVNLMPDEN